MKILLFAAEVSGFHEVARHSGDEAGEDAGLARDSRGLGFDGTMGRKTAHAATAWGAVVIALRGVCSALVNVIGREIRQTG